MEEETELKNNLKWAGFFVVSDGRNVPNEVVIEEKEFYISYRYG